jgi:hypothetical protein
MGSGLGRRIPEWISGNLEFVVVHDISKPLSGNHINNKTVVFEHLLKLSHFCDVLGCRVPEPAYGLRFPVRTGRHGEPGWTFEIVVEPIADPLQGLIIMSRQYLRFPQSCSGLEKSLASA